MQTGLKRCTRVPSIPFMSVTALQERSETKCANGIDDQRQGNSAAIMKYRTWILMNFPVFAHCRTRAEQNFDGHKQTIRIALLLNGSIAHLPRS